MQIDQIMMENILGLIAVTIVIFNSRRRALAFVILCFYGMYLTMDIAYVVDSTVADAPAWYLLNSMIDLLIMLLCIVIIMTRACYLRMAFLYLVYTAAMHLLPDIVQANLIKSELRYISTDAYAYIMTYAVYVDVLIAILGSDNLISRRIFQRQD